ncbi:MAG: LamG domain-containing protein [Fibrobacterales bacterium]
MYVLHILGFVLAIVFMGCTVNAEGPLAGTYIETTNAVAGIIYTSDSSFAHAAKVSLRPTGYLKAITSPDAQLDSSDRFTTETNNEGYFVIDSITPGEYVLEVTKQDTMARMIAITIPDDTTAVVVGEQLQRAMHVSGSIPLSELNTGVVDSMAHLWIQVYSLDRLIPVAEDGSFTTYLPAGSHTLRLVNGSKPSEGYDYSVIEGDAGSVLIVDSTGSFIEVPQENGETLSSADTLSSNSSGSVGGVSSASSSEDDLVREALYYNQLGLIFSGDTLIDLGEPSLSLDPGDGDFTVSFRFTYSDYAKHYLVMKGNTYSYEQGWSFFMVDSMLVWRVSSNDVKGDSVGKASLSFELNDELKNSMLTVVGVVNRSTGTLSAYINGSSVGWGQGGGGVTDGALESVTTIATTQSITIGGADGTVEGTSPGYQNEVIGDLRIFNEALTPEEVLDLNVTDVE